MAVKLLMTWNILPGREPEHFEFIVRDFIPSLQRMGLEMSDAWFTMYGNQPQNLVAAKAGTLDTIQRILASTHWNDLTAQLMEFVDDFKYKVVEAKSDFQM
ncbi:MAG: hypothetical protein ACOYYS_01015 [Chloroflexota bacterium]